MKFLSSALLLTAWTCHAFTSPARFTARHFVKSSSLNAQLEAILWGTFVVRYVFVVCSESLIVMYLLVDMDGVLADTERDGHRPAFNQAFEENNLDTVWTVERYGKLLEVGGGKERMTAHWNEVGWPANIAEDQRQEKVKELHLRKTDIFMDFINQKKIPLRPGVLRVIDDAIAAGLKLAVCSTSSEKAVRNLVNTLMGPERAAKFQIFAGDMVQKKKVSLAKVDWA